MFEAQSTEQRAVSTTFVTFSLLTLARALPRVCTLSKRRVSALRCFPVFSERSASSHSGLFPSRFTFPLFS
ncbi:hypothetical protein EDB89DRAFT_1928903 [Lactarius sanguifluus]|nr:hypothetical protein EDB89DRAFT_1928903 [Lactarius sanguifluus]